MNKTIAARCVISTAFWLGLGSAAVLSQCAHGAEKINPTLDLTSVRVEVSWHDNARDMQRAVRAWSPSTPVPAGALGASELRRNRETGEYVCYIFVVRPVTVDDSKSATLGHELLHCLYGDYHS